MLLILGSLGVICRLCFSRAEMSSFLRMDIFFNNRCYGTEKPNVFNFSVFHHRDGEKVA